MDFEPLAPACMKCEQVTGKSTCFPGPCVFFHERNIEGTKANHIATIGHVRRGMRETVHAPPHDSCPTCQGDCGSANPTPIFCPMRPSLARLQPTPDYKR